MKIRFHFIREKKADSAEGLLWAIRIFILIIAVVALTVLVESATSKLNDTHGFEYQIYSLRPLFSPRGISYFDADVQRLKIGVIDESRFTDETLDALYDDGFSKRFALHLSLRHGSVEKEIYYDKDAYEMYEPLVFASKYVRIRRTIYVTVKSADGLEAGTLDIDLIYRKED